MTDSTRAEKPPKPPKPYPEFPLYPHDTKRWAKKIKGRTHYFGPWSDWEGALERYKHEAPYLVQGKRPPERNIEAITVGDLVNHFLDHCEANVESGELVQVTYDNYKLAGTLIIGTFGRHTQVDDLTPDDFAKLRKRLSSRLSLTALGPVMQRCKAFFNYGYKNDLLDRPVKVGVSFDKPSRKAVLREKQSKPAKIFTITELQTLYHAAAPQMKAFMLLALNGGMGNADIGRLEFRHIQNGWINYPRPKTSVERTFPLWPETLKAIHAVKRKSSELPYVFITKYGGAWYKENGESVLSKEFRKLCIECKLHMSGRGFYSLRHQFRTIADECRDTPAIDHVMGHADPTMGGTYREWISPERLQTVVDHVRKWVKPMFRKPSKKEAAK